MESGSDPNADVPVGRLPRITRLMALAIRFDELIQNGEVTDYADLARLGHVSRARVTQIMNLLMLAPDIQEAIMHLPRVTSGRDPIHLRQLQPPCISLPARHGARSGRGRGSQPGVYLPVSGGAFQ